ncbi:MAG: hypothetical protein HOP28_15940 [Gemmatimonadales bacterium]|nr:hypothetical protein [Gemmatimonadales bacterium]
MIGAPLEIDVRAGDLFTVFERFTKETPGAVAVGVNRTVEEFLSEERRIIQGAMIVREGRFILPPQQLPRAWRATKDRLWAVADVGDDQGKGTIGNRRREILSPFEEGDVKRGDPRMPVAIPTRAIRPTPESRIPRSKYPRNMVGMFDSGDALGLGFNGRFQGLGTKARIQNVFKKKKGGTTQIWRKQVGRFFVLGQFGDRIHGVYERTGPGRRDVRMDWAFRPEVPRPAVLRFRATAQRIGDARLGANILGFFDLVMERGVPQASSAERQHAAAARAARG